MALKIKHIQKLASGENLTTEFGVGDAVRVFQRISDTDKKDEIKERTQVFEGTVIAVRGKGLGQTFTVRRIGAQKIGIEQIYPVQSPVVTKIEVVRQGMYGVRRAKLYYIRGKSKKEVEKIYSRSNRILRAKKAYKEKTAKKKAK
ncbi:50S ribosomal protein L19 [Candidatus Woesebacteria bacterium RIFOXYB1_FULL_38_16]|uniref:50S ribosomal protein L19 n=1 Tax=Candidatus Woesebacteria bacterium RIFOXYB1_FULL_38_16 TaxID=1802538 RepID=A0A1F8CT88_9BACT|nr:MAG: 50S ribosomal protein L19 [Candidatus Woesebacteria bacterium RIFOXYA1_FULL_38_9]OGM79557.1 MAG: 50S ribosomal protein L19 [Candidatus Woesebacteria bacterium RIFOXYB1_FULL_38_16]